MKIKACLTNKSDIWETPKNIYNFYIKRGYFDPCPINPEFDGLNIEWKEKNFVNPPYSKIKLWIQKAIKESSKGKYIILLVPARTDTQWFKKLYEANAIFYFIEGRLRFSDKLNAPFPSMLVVLTKEAYPFINQFNYFSKFQLSKIYP